MTPGNGGPGPLDDDRELERAIRDALTPEPRRGFTYAFGNAIALLLVLAVAALVLTAAFVGVVKLAGAL